MRLASSPLPDLKVRLTMLDAVFVLAGAGFLGLSVGYAIICDGL
jgi:hypothetical protein